MFGIVGEENSPSTLQDSPTEVLEIRLIKTKLTREKQNLLNMCSEELSDE